MISSIGKKIDLDSYKSDINNAGKILLIQLSDNTLLKEGTDDDDWLPLQLEYEKLNQNGGFLLSIIPKSYTLINSFVV